MVFKTEDTMLLPASSLLLWRTGDTKPCLLTGYEEMQLFILPISFQSNAKSEKKKKKVKWWMLFGTVFSTAAEPCMHCDLQPSWCIAAL